MPEQRLSVREIFDEAWELPPGERKAYLDKACGSDVALRAKIEELLRSEATAGDFLADPKRNGTIKITPMMESEGGRIGRYKILERVGEGGCGVVYVAEQTEPVRRRVALKVIKLGMDTKAVVARFEAERQALAMMDHPNIAKVLDGGSTETGRPYFVMELVRGIKITDYCDQANLSTKERLGLFIQVCQAIQHAHQKGIIHRDIKPSNILVTLNDGVPVPKVIDFGIAKATEGRLTDATVYTQLNQFIGTPAYMSPEQAEMSSLDIDTRSDIYSLGVLLYELLAGTTPFDGQELMSLGLDAMRKTIREKEPVRPSTRLATLQGNELTTAAKRRAIEAPRLIHLLKGDLDWIVMKCLEKDRTRRYDTANGLAADLKRHLSNEPVLARPPSKLYEFQKTFRRHKVAFAAAAAVFLALSAGVAVSSWQAVRANREASRAVAAEALARQRLSESEASKAKATAAEQEARAKATAEQAAREKSEAISKFMTEVFQSPDATRDGRAITVAETLDRAAEKLKYDLEDQPERQATLRDVLASTYYALGLYREAVPLEEKVRDYYLKTLGLEHPDTLTVMDKLAAFYSATGRKDEALKLGEEVLRLRRKVLGPEHPVTLNSMNDLAKYLAEDGRRDEAIKLWEEVLPLFRKVLGPEHPNTLMAMNNLALYYDDAGRKDVALKLAEEVLTLDRKVLGPEHPGTLLAMNNLAMYYNNAGRKDEGLKLVEEVLTLDRKVIGPEHPDTLTVMNNLAGSYFDAGRKDEGINLGEEALTLDRKVLGPEHPGTLTAMINLAGYYSAAGRKDEALKLREEVLTLERKVKGPEHPDTLRTMNNLAISYSDAGRKDEALKLRTELLALQRKAHEEEMTKPGASDRALAKLRQTVNANPTDTDKAKELATDYLWLGQTNEHQAICRKLLDLAANSKDPAFHDRVAKAYLIQAHPDPLMLREAVASGRQALQLAAKNDGLRAYFLVTAAMAEIRDRKPAEAESLLDEVLKPPGGDPNLRCLALAYRTMARAHLGRTAEARADLAKLEKLVPEFPAPREPVAIVLNPDFLAVCLAHEEAKALLNSAPTELADSYESAGSRDEALAKPGASDQALAALRQKVDANPGDSATAKELATDYLWLGQSNEHQAICHKLFDLAANSRDPAFHDRVAKAYLIQAHPDPETLKKAVASGRQALQLAASNDGFRAYFLVTAAMAEIRDGKPAEAESLLDEGLKLQGESDLTLRSLALAYRTLARAHLGHTEGARADLAELEKLVTDFPAPLAPSAIVLNPDFLAVCLAHEEAKALLNPSPPPTKP